MMTHPILMADDETTLEKPPLVQVETFVQSVEQHLQQYFNAHRDIGLPPPGLYDRLLRLVEKPLIEHCLRATNCNQVRAALLLGINRNTLRKKINELGIKTGN